MPATLVPKAECQQLRPLPWAPGLGAAGAGHRDPAQSRLPSEEMKALFLTPVFPQKGGMVQSEAPRGRLESERRRRMRGTQSSPRREGYALP